MVYVSCGMSMYRFGMSMLAGFASKAPNIWHFPHVQPQRSWPLPDPPERSNVKAVSTVSTFQVQGASTRNSRRPGPLSKTTWADPAIFTQRKLLALSVQLSCWFPAAVARILLSHFARNIRTAGKIIRFIASYDFTGFFSKWLRLDLWFQGWCFKWCVVPTWSLNEHWAWTWGHWRYQCPKVRPIPARSNIRCQDDLTCHVFLLYKYEYIYIYIYIYIWYMHICGFF